jgi:hypothetical protein
MDQMRDALLLLGLIAVTACSLDHVVVAALEDGGVNGSSAGDASSSRAGSAASAEAPANAGSAGTRASPGLTAEGEAGRASTAAGGSADRGVLLTAAGAGGVTDKLLCSCLDQQLEFCGSDGVTYPTECGDAGPCFPPAIDCWHACPCLDPELDAGADVTSTTSWFSPDCLPSTPCTGDSICMMFSDVDNDAQTICATAN